MNALIGFICVMLYGTANQFICECEFFSALSVWNIYLSILQQFIGCNDDQHPKECYIYL